mmetsp:Transcript_37625/g.94304  ORF Transcript_37625/g.94304 Transcript_37625/m.94304 type:complete len:273 (+) Transcript_37625:358-1176(+)|eukprot:CAMPEP_0173472014 /NCGR_PEP_ID=MMETSP1357-20121228/78683_1 /TAXON_ID=77926 /ORGANISM="Hemiselmis rufescens, Strain PCC563" /LENGTH=272 /DNA_ID=CAMNT_0014440331 /DNA_START=756 /DNA_END=1574 /DNA_ORIENTATION=+
MALPLVPTLVGRSSAASARVLCMAQRLSGFFPPCLCLVAGRVADTPREELPRVDDAVLDRPRCLPHLAHVAVTEGGACAGEVVLEDGDHRGGVAPLVCRERRVHEAPVVPRLADALDLELEAVIAGVVVSLAEADDVPVEQKLLAEGEQGPPVDRGPHGRLGVNQTPPPLHTPQLRVLAADARTVPRNPGVGGTETGGGVPPHDEGGPPSPPNQLQSAAPTPLLLKPGEGGRSRVRPLREHDALVVEHVPDRALGQQRLVVVFPPLRPTRHA